MIGRKIEINDRRREEARERERKGKREEIYLTLLNCISLTEMPVKTFRKIQYNT